MKLFSIVLATLISKASANPEGAGACPAGEAAPGGSHLIGSPGLVGSLSSGGEFVMTVGGVEVSDGAVIDASLDFDITVTTATGAGFRGILIRVGGTTTDQVTSTDLTAPAGACGDVGSVTHSDKSLKTTGTAIISLDEGSLLDIDISLVIENEPEEGVSEFFYSSFQINALAADLVSNSPPAVAPTSPPVLEVPTDNSVAPPTMAPLLDNPSFESDPPTTAPDGTPSVESDDPLPSIPVAEPTSEALTIAGAAAAFAGALFTFAV